MSSCNKKVLVTGSSGLIGSEAVSFFYLRSYEVHGIDNNQRAVFFGLNGDVRWKQMEIQKKYKDFKHYDIDIRDRNHILNLIERLKPDIVIHTASQPSHDLAKKIPFEDFEINAVGTLNLLEACRRFYPNVIFIHMSTNKVYGDNINKIKLKELDTRWDYDDSNYTNGINENFSIDHTKHSLFGVSKLASDIMVQEYGKYFNMRTCCLRGGCFTGPNHNGVELHGFLSYLIRCNLKEEIYRIYGYKGKQVRDNIHSRDVVNLMMNFIESPKIGEVYNIGGGRDNSCSILEAFEKVEKITGKRMKYEYVDENRDGDHICYISDLSKVHKDFPDWKLTKPLDISILEIIESWTKRISQNSLTAS